MSVGGVYKKNAEFEVEEVFSSIFRGGVLTNTLKIPDSIGFGIAIKPNDSITLTSDLVRIEYSDLAQDLASNVGTSVIAFLSDFITVNSL